MALFPCNLGSSGGTVDFYSYVAANHFYALSSSSYGTSVLGGTSFTGNYITVTSKYIVTAKVACHVRGYYLIAGTTTIQSIDRDYAANEVINNDGNRYIWFEAH